MKAAETDTVSLIDLEISATGFEITREQKKNKSGILFKGLNNENALATYTRIRAACVTAMEEHLKSQDSKTKLL